MTRWLNRMALAKPPCRGHACRLCGDRSAARSAPSPRPLGRTLMSEISDGAWYLILVLAGCGWLSAMAWVSGAVMLLGEARRRRREKEDHARSTDALSR